MITKSAVALTKIDEAVSQILEQHKPLLECLVMSSAERWVALDELITQAARDSRATKREIMKGIGWAMNRENLDGYVKSLKVMISRAKAKMGTAKRISKERKKGFEAILEKLGKMDLTTEQVVILYALLERKGMAMGNDRWGRLPTHLPPFQAEGVTNC